MRCTPTIHELIVLTLPPRYRCPLNRLPASRLLLPRSGLERSDFVLWPQAAVWGCLLFRRCQGRSRHHPPRRRSRDTSILRMPRSARERDRVAHVGKPGDVGERALEAEAEAGVRYRAVAAQVAIPAVVLPV